MKHAGRLTINGGADNSPARPVRVFCAYSRRDQSYREELVTYLSGLERDGLISIWFDRMISPGIDWNREIAAELDSAEIILLLLSADFVKSAYCVGVEMKRAQERAHRKEIRAVPIFIRPYYWPGSPLHAFQGLPSNGKPVKKWKDREDAYVEIARGIEIVAAEIRKPAATRTNIGSAESPILSGFSSVKFDNRDMLGWMGSMFTWWRKLSKYAWQEPDPVPTALPDKSRVALFGCWGTGLYGAPVVSKSISSDPRGYQLLLHLGNTYYSGTASEIRDQLIAPWPRVPGAVSRALCGNHEMYTGGTAYIEAVQNEFGQMSSAFAFQNDHWILACLDTAYDDNDLYGNQAVWLENLLNRAGGRRLILVSHHFPFSQFEPPSPKLVAKLIPLLRSRMIFAWYWAHEHICALYEPHPLWGFLGRCAGHGGFPYLRLRLPGSRPEDTQFIRVASKALIPAADVLDGPNPYVTGSETAYGPHGFLSLEFDGPKLVERVHSAEGNVLREQVLA